MLQDDPELCERGFSVFCDRLEAAFPEETRTGLTVGAFRGRERELDPASSLFIPQIISARVQ